MKGQWNQGQFFSVLRGGFTLAYSKKPVRLPGCCPALASCYPVECTFRATSPPWRPKNRSKTLLGPPPVERARVSEQFFGHQRGLRHGPCPARSPALLTTEPGGSGTLLLVMVPDCHLITFHNITTCSTNQSAILIQTGKKGGGNFKHCSPSSAYGIHRPINGPAEGVPLTHKKISLN